MIYITGNLKIMKIKINGKKYKIKPAAELTAGEYIEFTNLVTPGTSALMATIKYLQVVTKQDFVNVMGANVGEGTLRKIGAYVGGLTPMQTYAEQRTEVLTIDGKTIRAKDLDPTTVGARAMFEQAELTTDAEAVVHLLSVMLSGYDSDEAERQKVKILELNAAEVFRFGTFFFVKIADWLTEKKKILEAAGAFNENKHTIKIKNIVGQRLDPYRFMGEIDFILSKRLAENINDALKLSDIYVTLFQAREAIIDDVTYQLTHEK